MTGMKENRIRKTAWRLFWSLRDKRKQMTKSAKDRLESPPHRTFQPFRLREWCALLLGLFLAFLLVRSLVLYFNLRLFHINNKVLSDY